MIKNDDCISNKYMCYFDNLSEQYVECSSINFWDFGVDPEVNLSVICINMRLLVNCTNSAKFYHVLG